MINSVAHASVQVKGLQRKDNVAIVEKRSAAHRACLTNDVSSLPFPQ